MSPVVSLVAVLPLLFLAPAATTPESPTCAEDEEGTKWPRQIPDYALPLCDGDFEKFYEVWNDEGNKTACTFVSTFGKPPSDLHKCDNALETILNSAAHPPVYLEDSPLPFHYLLEFFLGSDTIWIFNNIDANHKVELNQSTVRNTSFFALPFDYWALNSTTVLDMNDFGLKPDREMLIPFATLEKKFPAETFERLQSADCWGPRLKCVFDMTNVKSAEQKDDLWDFPLRFEEPSVVYFEDDMAIVAKCHSRLTDPCTYMVKDYKSQQLFYVPRNLTTFDASSWRPNSEVLVRIPILRTARPQFKKRREQLTPGIYSLPLEAQAQQLVDTCVHKFQEYPNIAQNAIKLAGIKPINATTAQTVVNSWFNQLKAQGLQSVALTSRDNTALRGFVRMAWATSREMGCAMKQCPSISSTLAVCLYSTAAVKVGSRIYGPGTGCKKNADCTSYAGSTCTVATGLCYSKPPVPATTTAKPTTKPATILLTTTTTSTSTLKPTTTLLTTLLTSTPTKTSTSTLKPTTTLLTTTTTVVPTSTSTLKPTSTSTSTTTTKPSTSTPTTTKPTSTSTKPTTASTTPATTTTTTTPPDPQMTDALRQLSVDLHNQFRSSAALGNLAGKNGAKFPQAAGMAAAAWSENEWNFAFNTVLATCVYGSGSSYNVQVWTTPSYLPPEKALNDSINAWAATLSQYDPSNLVINKTGSLGTHLIWNEPNTEFKVGCAVKYWPKNQTRVACAYRPYGNVEGNPIYATGSPCSTCSAAQQCVAGKGLCTYVNETVIPNLTDAQRMISLNAHNTNRSTVAKGLAVNKNGTTIPPAKNMVKATWSKTLESYAKKAVAPCVWAHTQQNGTGQNLYASWYGNYATIEFSFDDAVRQWYDELVEDGQNSLTMDGSNFNHFTQVVWAESVEIGCAVAYCSTVQGLTGTQVSLVACQYAPHGNVASQVIYQAGTTCSACPSGSTCEPATGLCVKAGVAAIHD